MDYVLKVSRIGNTILFLIGKFANYHLSIPLKQYLENKCYNEIVFSMPNTKYIDSSFFGLLLKLGIQGSHNNKKITVYTSEPISMEMKEYSIDTVVSIVTDIKKFPDTIFVDVPLTDVTKKDQIRSIISDHSFLTKLSDKNKVIFHNLIKQLNIELRDLDNE